MKRIFALIILPFILTLFAIAGQEGYYRFPSLVGSNVVFTAEGDLWIVGVDGGTAQRLTSHPGSETHAYASPDGSLIAFSAQYEGPTEVYTMPVQGGLPTRRTFEGEAAIVVGWTPDGKIIYSSGHYATLPSRQLLTLDLTTGLATLIPLSQASDGCYDDKGTLFFTRLPFQGSHTKRYKGGTAQNIWKYATGQTDAVPLTSDFTGTSKIPMWWSDRIYFASDRDGTMNLWSMDQTGKNLKQLTFHKGFDVRYPALRDGKIVYQDGADIYLFNIASNTDAKIPITLESDFDQTRDKWVKKPMDYLASSNISNNGDRVTLTARGQVFVAPAEPGRLVQATRNDKIRYRSARFFPDGKSLLALSDESGELEFWKIPANGVGDIEQLTHDGKVFRSDGIPSPDGKRIAFDDKFQRLWIYTIDSKEDLQVDSSDMSGFSNIQWSPDSKWLAYDVSGENQIEQIKLYSIEDEKLTLLTDDRVDCYNPVWSPDGKWIYFLSDRTFQSLVSSPWGSRQPEPFFDKTTQIFNVSLLKDGRSPFLPTDEVVAAASPEPKKDTSSKSVNVKIDLTGIQDRITALPTPAGNYRNLSINDKYLFWIESSLDVISKTKLASLEITNKEAAPKTVLEDIVDYNLSGDGKKILVHKADDFYVFDASGSPPSDLVKSKVNLSSWTFSINPRQEWRQMFVEAWRLERDYFYAPNLHGAKYTDLLQQDLPLVDRVTDRDELNDLITGLVGELAALHTFVVGGDSRVGPDQITPASLGALLTKDEADGGYKIQHIYLGDPDYPDVSSPLVKPGVNVHEGDVIKTINGVSTLSVESPSLLLRNQAGQQVLLGMYSATSGKDYNAIVKPFTPADESNLRYTEWEYTRRLQVEKASNNDIGYVHLRAMGGGNYTEWVKNFYPVFDRKGLIIDVRSNRGGNIDSWILEKLLRKAWFYWKPRTGAPTWNMQYAFRGHVVVLCNENTASDGEAFTEGIRRLNIGKIIGTRTWGGEVWLSFDTYLKDKGIASAAEMGVYGPEGNWLIEGHGVDPDTIVDNMPHATFEGSDSQLDAAINYLKNEILLHPIVVPPPPAYPDKSMDNEGKK